MPPLTTGWSVRLRDGTEAGLQAGLTALYGRLSSESAHQRFFTVMRRLPPDWARILASPDPAGRAALVATGPGSELVGVARHAPGPRSDEVEIALVVQDAWQGRGLGTALLAALLDRARERGISRFVAHVLSDNRRMRRLIEAPGVVTERAQDRGVVTVRLTSRPARERAAPTRLATPGPGQRGPA